MEGVQVMQHALFSGRKLKSCSMWLSLAEFVADFDPPTSSSSGPSHSGPSASSGKRLSSEMLAAYPWLEQCGVAEKKQKVGVGVAKKKQPQESAPVLVKPLVEDDVEKTLDALKLKRAEWAQDESDKGPSHFKVIVAGGKWTKASLGVDFDCAKGVIVGTAAKQFCLKYNLQQSASFSCSKYDEHKAHILASAWCDKMEYMFGVAEDAESTGEIHLHAASMRWVQPLNLAEMMADNPDSVLLSDRCWQIVRLSIQ